MDWLHKQLVENKQKAIVGFVMVGATAIAVKHGINLDTITGKQLIEAILYGFLGFLGVFYKKNQ